MIAPLAVPLLVLGAMLLAALRGADVYEAMTEGAKKGLQLTWSILPSLLVIFPALRLLRAAGVPVELKETRGTYHGFDIKLDRPFSQRALEERADVLRRVFYGE